MPRGIYKRKPFKKEHKRKISNSLLGKKGNQCSSKTKDKISKANKKVYSDNIKRKEISDRNKGKKVQQKTKDKISRTLKGKYSGKKSWLWRGGKSCEIYPIDWTETLKESIRQRDDYVCQECGIHIDELIGKIKKLDIHHIDYDKKNCNPINLITLCRSCHVKTNGNREHWIEYFNN